MKNQNAFLVLRVPLPVPRFAGRFLAVIPALFLTATLEAGVFKQSQVGLYTGTGTVRAVISGVPRDPVQARSRIRVRSSSLALDGVRFRLANRKVRGRYYAYGLSMVLDGTYSRAGNRVLARGSVEILSLEAGATVDASWAFRLSADGKRANYVLAISIPDPDDPTMPLATINARARGAKP